MGQEIALLDFKDLFGLIFSSVFATDWLRILLLMFAFAAVPAIPAVILRVKFPVVAYNLLAAAGIVLGVISLAVIIFGGGSNESLFFIAQCVLLSTVPALFCAAFAGTKHIWLALAPSMLYFLSFLLSYSMAFGVSAMLMDFFSGMIIFIVGMSLIFFIWALLCILAANMIYKLFKKIENKSDEKSRDKFGRIKRRK